MKIASWNINSIRTRLPTFLQWLKQEQPDVVCLQEIKCRNEQFPTDDMENLGYNLAVHGQKSYNGVAILSRYAIEEITTGLPHSTLDEQARYIEALIEAPDGPVRVASIYLPNGNPKASDKFDYKLAFMRRLTAHAKTLLGYEEKLVLAGDYNVIFRDEDCWDPAVWADDALYAEEVRNAFAELLWTGLTDAWMAKDGRPHHYTFWDYQRGAWQRGHGIHIDHLLLSPQAADVLESVHICKDARAMDKPSDHVPVMIELDA
jgi:exodeoxyribonuclease III